METLATENGAALCRTERDRGLLPASRAGGLRFHLVVTISLPGCRRCTQHRDTLGLAHLATLWFVLKLLVVEEKLFPSCENKVASTVHTLEHLVLKFHRGWLPSARLRAPTREERTAVVHRKYRFVYYSPSTAPWTRPATLIGLGVGTAFLINAGNTGECL